MGLTLDRVRKKYTNQSKPVFAPAAHRCQICATSVLTIRLAILIDSAISFCEGKFRSPIDPTGVRGIGATGLT